HQCGLRDGVAKHGQFCIDQRLAYALAGDIKRGLFFRGSEALPFGNRIRPARELIDYLITGTMPAGDGDGSADPAESTGSGALAARSPEEDSPIPLHQAA